MYFRDWITRRETKMIGKRWFYAKTRMVVLGCIAAIVLLQPLRSILLSPIIPVTWADSDNAHLFRVMHDVQKFEVGAFPVVNNTTIWKQVQVNLSLFKDMELKEEKSYPEFWKHLKELKATPQTDIIKEKTELISKFQPVMTPKEKAQLLFAFAVLAHACRVADLTYFLMEASLMGTIRHHGMIPWDDDIDIVMNADQWKEIRNVLGNIDGFELYAPSDSQWKFYMKSASSFPDKPFKFPNIDIFFYTGDETHIWSLTKGLKHDLVYKRSEIFPLSYRPFEDFQVPVPWNLNLVVHRSHDQNICITPEYVHKTNEPHFYSGKTAIDCEQLYDIYPFVFADQTADNPCQREHLMIGEKLISTETIVTVSCSTVKSRLRNRMAKGGNTGTPKTS